MNTLRDFLTYKQQLFCDEYLTDMNATRAALRAGYSSGTALNGQLMRMPKIKMYLEERMGEQQAKAQITQDMVLKELGKIAFGNMGNYFDEAGRIKPMHLLSDDDKAALWSVSVSDAGSGGSGEVITKFRLYNKLSALDKIAKHLNFYKPEAEQPKTTYVYMDADDMVEDDWFEDENEDEESDEEIDEEDLEEEEFEEEDIDEEHVVEEEEPVVKEEPVHVFRESAEIAAGFTQRAPEVVQRAYPYPVSPNRNYGEREVTLVRSGELGVKRLWL